MLDRCRGCSTDCGGQAGIANVGRPGSLTIAGHARVRHGTGCNFSIASSMPRGHGSTLGSLPDSGQQPARVYVLGELFHLPS
jgi:hypothetical protein